MSQDWNGGDVTHAAYYSQVRRDVAQSHCIDVDMLDYCAVCKTPMAVWEYTREPVGKKQTGVCRTLSRSLKYAVPVVLVGAITFVPGVTKSSDDTVSMVRVWFPEDVAKYTPTFEFPVDRAQYVNLVARVRIKFPCPLPGCAGQPAPSIRQSPTAVRLASDGSVALPIPKGITS